MPLVFERAFGGSDHTHEDPKRQGTELRNPLGVGFHKNSDAKAIKGTPLPNLEDRRNPIRKWSDAPVPMGLGHLGRGWQPRIKFAGTYDDRWLKERFPFLPEDFDPQYFQSAPADQQVQYLRGGEVIRCTNLSQAGLFKVVVPRQGDVQILFRFHSREVKHRPNLDTLTIEPDLRRILLVWRTMISLDGKMSALREILVDDGATSRKPHFQSINDLLVWQDSNE
jgi:hypothetical protein